MILHLTQLSQYIDIFFVCVWSSQLRIPLVSEKAIHRKYTSLKCLLILTQIQFCIGTVLKVVQSQNDKTYCIKITFFNFLK